MSILAPTDTFDIFKVIECKDDHMEDSIIKSQIHTRLRSLVDQASPTGTKDYYILPNEYDLRLSGKDYLTY